MHVATISAFFDELGHIKTAGLMSNVGMKILHTAKALPRNIQKGVQGGIENAGKAVGAFSTPIKSLKEGTRFTVKDFHSLSRTQKVLMGGGLVASGHEALSKTDPLGKRRGRGERVGAAIGDQMGGLVGAPFGLAGGFVAGQIGRKAGGTVGKGVDLIRKHRKASAPPST